jgi:hypothetical protein
MDNNSVYRYQPLNNNQCALAMDYHNHGILQGVRATPKQYGSMQPNMEDKVNMRHAFWRVTPSVNSNLGKPHKYIPPGSASSVTTARKQNAIGKSSYYSHNELYSTKDYNVNDSRSSLRMVRSGGSVAPKKKGAV